MTASGSGLDPHISPAAALYQVARVAAARGLDERPGARSWCEAHVEGRQLGSSASRGSTCCVLNLALDGAAD